MGLGILSGLFSFLFVNCVTRVLALIAAGKMTTINITYVLIFAGVILLFVLTRRTLAVAIVNLSQKLFWDLRMQVLQLVLHANYQQLTCRRPRVHTAMVNDVSVLMEASLSIIQFSTSTILALSCFVFLASVSLPLFFITLVIALSGISVYHFSSGRNRLQFIGSRTLENKFQETFISILDGFKEIFIDPAKGQFIYEHQVKAIARKSYASNKKAFTGYINNQITGQVLFYVLISAILLVFSIIWKVRPANTVTFIFTLLYLLGSIESIMVLLPGIVRAGVASSHLSELKNELEAAGFSNPVPEVRIPRDEFDRLQVINLAFRYGQDSKAFGVGPVNMEVRKGDVVFIYGGNGSGKTTFIHTLIGLCLPTAGRVRLNEMEIDEDNYAFYRTVFSVVFSDFYLFSELPQVDCPDKEKWDYYVRLFELEGKVQLEGRRYTTTELSTGQRKRLALIAALLEERPVLVLDEWAADQDPYFRKKFYTEIIPLLKKEGVTIIAVTHDDAYYYCADKLYKMDYGYLIQEFIHDLEPFIAN